MIVVKIEMWPGGNPSKAREIGRTYINNMTGFRPGFDPMTHDGKRGDYDVRVARKGSKSFAHMLKVGPMRHGHVDDYPRLSYNVWRLVIRALRSAFPEEK